ncbi:unnamed protein product [Meganyctiphanes norvegica]|uniref:Uncharacterized protein n=1 Tax=Meganyctiphanes norvegica TaxID=48144 RepID=A0AAV2S2R1_MEGNR
MKVTAIAIFLFAVLSVACGAYRYGYRPSYKRVYKSYARPVVHHPLAVGYHGHGHSLHVASPGAHVAISGYGHGNGVYVASNPGATHVAPLYG